MPAAPTAAEVLLPEYINSRGKNTVSFVRSECDGIAVSSVFSALHPRTHLALRSQTVAIRSDEEQTSTLSLLELTKEVLRL